MPSAPREWAVLIGCCAPSPLPRAVLRHPTLTDITPVKLLPVLPSTFHRATCLALTRTPGAGHCHRCHFTDAETEAERLGSLSTVTPLVVTALDSDPRSLLYSGASGLVASLGHTGRTDSGRTWDTRARTGAGGLRERPERDSRPVLRASANSVGPRLRSLCNDRRDRGIEVRSVTERRALPPALGHQHGPSWGSGEWTCSTGRHCSFSPRRWRARVSQGTV